LRKKSAKGLGDIWDPGSIPIKLKPKKEDPEEIPAVIEEAAKVEEVAEPAVPLPKWTSRGWKRPGGDEAQSNPGTEQASEPAPEPQEDPKPLSQPKDEPPEIKIPSLKVEEAAPDPTPEAPVFRKRKVAAPARGRR
jgi:WW domain-binding protein 4